MTALAQALGSPGHRLHWFVELPWIKPDLTVETRYRATAGWTSRADDSIAPHRHYSGRLQVPAWGWSLVDEDALSGKTTPNLGALSVLDPDGRDRDAIDGGWSLDGASIVLRYGTLDMDLAEMGEAIVTGARVVPKPTGGYDVQLAGLERTLDKRLERSTYWGMGGCLEFDGAGGQSVAVTASDDFAATSYFMVEAAIEPTAVTGAVRWIAGRGNLGSRDWLLAIGTDGKPLFSVTRDDGEVATVTGLDSLNALDLARVAGEWTGSALQLRIDGEVVASTAWAGPLRHSPGYDLTIGAQSFQGLNPYVGKLDDVRLWVDQPRDEADIEAYSQRQLILGATYDGLALWLPMDEGIDGICYDESGKGHNGEIKGSPQWSSLFEGEVDQHGQARPVAIGESYGVPGMQVDSRVYGGGSRQLHDGQVRVITAEEGGARLGRRLDITSTAIRFAVAGGRSYIISEDPDLDLDGIRNRQFIEVTGSTSNDGIHRAFRSDADAIPVASTLQAEPAGASVTLRTAGYHAAGSDLTFHANGTITSSSTDLTGLYPGSVITITGSASNDGTYTSADYSFRGIATVSEPLTAEAAGAAVVIAETDERWDYIADLERGIAHLRAAPTLPLSFHVRGDADPAFGGYVEAAAPCIERLAVKYGQWPAGDVNTASIAAAAALYPHAVGLWLGKDDGATDDGITVADAIDRIARPLLYWGPNLGTGQLEVVGLTEPAAFEDADLVLDDTNLFEVETRDGRPPVAGLELHYRRNRVVISGDELAGWLAEKLGVEGVPPADTWRGGEWSSVSPPVIDGSIAERFKSATTPPAIESAIAHEIDALEAVQALYDRDKAGHRFLIGRGPLSLVALDHRSATVGVSSSRIPYAAAGWRLICWRLDERAATVHFCLWRPSK